KVENIQASHDRVGPVVKVGDHAQLKSAARQFLEHFPGLWKEHPSVHAAKPVVHLIEELVEVFHHSDFAEDAVDNILPPSFLILNRYWAASAAELPLEGGLNNVGRGIRTVLPSDAPIDFADRTSRREQCVCGIENHGAKFHVGIITKVEGR